MRILQGSTDNVNCDLNRALKSVGIERGRKMISQRKGTGLEGVRLYRPRTGST